MRGAEGSQQRTVCGSVMAAVFGALLLVGAACSPTTITVEAARATTSVEAQGGAEQHNAEDTRNGAETSGTRSDIGQGGAPRPDAEAARNDQDSVPPEGSQETSGSDSTAPAVVESIATPVPSAIAQPSATPTPAIPTPASAQSTATSVPLPASEPTTTPTPTMTSEATATPVPTATPAPTPTPTAAATATPVPTATPTSTPTPTPTSVPTATSDPIPSPDPTPSVAPNVPAAGADDDDDDPAVGEDGVAPEDGDSPDQPERPGDPGFLLGSVSGPVGDRSDWSEFEVSLGDPTTAFVGLFCTSFSGSGNLVVTVSTEADPIGQLRCTQGQQQDETTLSLRVGSTYLVSAEFQGSGYADWFIQASDDD